MAQRDSQKFSTLRRCISVFSRKDRRKIGLVVILQTLLGAMDLLGVMLIGIIGSLAVTGIQSSGPGIRVSKVLEILHLEAFSFQEQTAILGIIATAVLIGRTMLSVVFTRKVLFFIGRRSAIISSDLVNRLLQQNILQINSKSIQETIYASTNGVVSVTMGVVGTAVILIADVSLLAVMAAGLFFVDPIIALCSFLLFSGVGIVLYQIMHRKATKFGKLNAELNIRSNEKISEVLTSYREATVRNRRSYYAQEIGNARMELSNALAELSFMPSISKYAIEASMVIGAVTITGLQFSLQDSKHAIATLAVFLAAGSRIAPAILRVQQGSIAIKSGIGSAQQTLELIDSLKHITVITRNDNIQFDHKEFSPSLQFKDVSFKYPGSSKFAIQDINLDISEGSLIAIVGPSGSGKTTIVDLLLGMFEPTSGSILISGKRPNLCLSEYPGSIGYVPQDVAIIEGTVRENVSMGFPIQLATDKRVREALQTAKLLDFIKSLPNDVDSSVGARGSKLSGGQRQRLGIARAMFTSPKLLILDESTSALDAHTEYEVTKAISEIPYAITKVVIAHRLSTVLKADVVYYVENGQIKAHGTFAEVRAVIPNFDEQAKLHGM
jgi:ABC-type branched-subunit amino acid transport system ATPase component